MGAGRIVSGFAVRPLLALAVFSAFVMPAVGQTTNGALVGSVTDQSGSLVANASITITHETTGDTRKVLSNTEGQYTAPVLPIGRYTVQGEAPGFKRVRVSNVLLEVNQTVRVDLAMELGAVTQTVEVAAEVALVKTDRSD